MHTLDGSNNRPIRLFHEMFGSRLSRDDYMEFFSNRRKAGTDTYLRLDIFRADKLATIVTEEYGVRGKLTGHVIVVFPEPRHDIPIFMLQLGGNATQSIALLDISPARPGTDYAPLRPAYEKYRDLLQMEDSCVEWVSSISSPCLLHRQYGPLDLDVFMEAAREYLRIWIEDYYEPAGLLEGAELEQATAGILRYKRVMHDNDPAHGIFSKAWGRPVADAFIHLETRDHPALTL